MARPLVPSYERADGPAGLPPVSACHTQDIIVFRTCKVPAATQEVGERASRPACTPP